MTSLSKNVKFSIEKNSDKGSFVVRSKTESFNLEHIVDKDIVSFYGELSKYGIIDTGILPLSGTGVLAIRSAGNHTQITFQHAPQINYINWGAHEGDRNAKTYLVAQPYRIWIGDTIDGNLFGARMFYSPYPITSANQVLYHLNLPNTNCRGYRGNGVGWQCLYHKDDWSKLPLNEKIVRFAERCSGVETFNDNNMSETDGPRFYASYYGENSNYEYLWNPTSWQEKTESEGLDWVLDENIWIPVLVEDLDKQDRHYEEGKPLTLGMALVGNYQAYYHDPYKPKPINALTRSDLFSEITPDVVTSWIMRSHNSAKTAYVPSNPIEDSAKHREEVVSKSSQPVFNNSEEEEEEDENIANFICPISGEACSAHQDETLIDSLDNTYCSSCYEEHTVYCENSDSTLPAESEYVYYHSSSGEYYDVRGIDFNECPNCNSLKFVPAGKQPLDTVLYHDKEGSPVFCASCAQDYLKENYPDYAYSCSQCTKSLPINQNGSHLPEWDHIVKTVTNVYLNGSDEIVEETHHYCMTCAHSSYQCPTGHTTWLPLASLPVPLICEVDDSVKKSVQITHICASCANPDIWQLGLSKEKVAQLSTLFSVVTKAEERFQHSYNKGILENNPYVIDASKPKETDDELPF